MKKLMLILLAFAFITASVLAQSTARTADSHVMSARKTYYKYTGVAADTVGTDRDTLYFELQVNKNVPVNCNVRIEATQTGSTDDYEIRFQGKVFENDNWASLIDSSAQIASLSLYHPDVRIDSTLAGSADVFYRYFRVLIGSDGDVAADNKFTINYVIWKIYGR